MSIKCGDAVRTDRHSDTSEPCNLDLRPFGYKINPGPRFQIWWPYNLCDLSRGKTDSL